MGMLVINFLALGRMKKLEFNSKYQSRFKPKCKRNIFLPLGRSLQDGVPIKKDEDTKIEN